MLMLAKVVADYGKSYLIEDGQATVYRAQTRGKKVDYACGDRVLANLLNNEQAVIESCLPRANILYRANSTKSKIIATNVDQILFIASVLPRLDENLLQRALLAAEASNISLIIILNKIDIIEYNDDVKKIIDFYRKMGYKCEFLAAINDVSNLKPYLLNKTSILIGQSGVGKSTIVNQLFKQHQTKVGEISVYKNKGKHTTTYTVMYRLQNNGYIIDSPGLQKFGLYYIPIGELIQYFPDFKMYIGQCRFRNCTHHQEPGCAIKSAFKAGKVQEFRLKFLQEIIQENSIKVY